MFALYRLMQAKVVENTNFIIAGNTKQCTIECMKNREKGNVR